MSEEPTTETNTEEVPSTTTTEVPGEKSYTQSDVDAITEKVRKGLESKLNASTKQLEELRTKALTDSEKEIEDAKESGRSEVRTELDSLKRQSSIELLLALEGVENAGRVALLIDPDVAPEDGVAKLKKDMPQLFGTRTSVGGGRLPDTQGTPEMTEDYVSEMLQAHGQAWLTPERRDKLTKWRDANNKGFRRL